MFVTGIAGVFGVSVGVTHIAGRVGGLPVIERKGVYSHRRWRPGVGLVAVLTVEPEETSVDSGLCVTLPARDICSLKGVIGMTICASQGCMRPFEREDPLVVKTMHSIHTVMTGHALFPILG